MSAITLGLGVRFKLWAPLLSIWALEPSFGRYPKKLYSKSD